VSSQLDTSKRSFVPTGKAFEIKGNESLFQKPREALADAQIDSAVERRPRVMSEHHAALMGGAQREQILLEHEVSESAQEQVSKNQSSTQSDSSTESQNDSVNSDDKEASSE